MSAPLPSINDRSLNSAAPEFVPPQRSQTDTKESAYRNPNSSAACSRKNIPLSTAQQSNLTAFLKRIFPISPAHDSVINDYFPLTLSEFITCLKIVLAKQKAFISSAYVINEAAEAVLAGTECTRAELCICILNMPDENSSEKEHLAKQVLAALPYEEEITQLQTSLKEKCAKLGIVLENNDYIGFIATFYLRFFCETEFEDRYSSCRDGGITYDFAGINLRFVHQVTATNRMTWRVSLTNCTYDYLAQDSRSPNEALQSLITRRMPNPQYPLRREELFHFSRRLTEGVEAIAPAAFFESIGKHILETYSRHDKKGLTAAFNSFFANAHLKPALPKLNLPKPLPSTCRQLNAQKEQGNETSLSMEFLNLLHMFQQVQDSEARKSYCHTIANAWLQRQPVPEQLREFVELISAYPQHTGDLLNIVRGLFLYEAGRPNPNISAYSHRFAENPKTPRFSVAIQQGQDTSYLALMSDPVATMADFFASWRNFEKSLAGNKTDLERLLNLPKILGLPSPALSKENIKVYANDIAASFSRPPFSSLLIQQFEDKLSPAKLYESLIKECSSDIDVDSIEFMRHDYQLAKISRQPKTAMNGNIHALCDLFRKCLQSPNWIPIELLQNLHAELQKMSRQPPAFGIFTPELSRACHYFIQRIVNRACVAKTLDRLGLLLQILSQDSILNFCDANYRQSLLNDALAIMDKIALSQPPEALVQLYKHIEELKQTYGKIEQINKALTGFQTKIINSLIPFVKKSISDKRDMIKLGSLADAVFESLMKAPDPNIDPKSILNASHMQRMYEYEQSTSSAAKKPLLKVLRTFNHCMQPQAELKDAHTQFFRAISNIKEVHKSELLANQSLLKTFKYYVGSFCQTVVVSPDPDSLKQMLELFSNPHIAPLYTESEIREMTSKLLSAYRCLDLIQIPVQGLLQLYKKVETAKCWNEASSLKVADWAEPLQESLLSGMLAKAHKGVRSSEISGEFLNFAHQRYASIASMDSQREPQRILDVLNFYAAVLLETHDEKMIDELCEKAIDLLPKLGATTKMPAKLIELAKSFIPSSRSEMQNVQNVHSSILKKRLDFLKALISRFSEIDSNEVSNNLLHAIGFMLAHSGRNPRPAFSVIVNVFSALTHEKFEWRPFCIFLSSLTEKIPFKERHAPDLKKFILDIFNLDRFTAVKIAMENSVKFKEIFKDKYQDFIFKLYTKLPQNADEQDAALAHTVWKILSKCSLSEITWFSFAECSINLIGKLSHFPANEGQVKEVAAFAKSIFKNSFKQFDLTLRDLELAGRSIKELPPSTDTIKKTLAQELCDGAQGKGLLNPIEAQALFRLLTNTVMYSKSNLEQLYLHLVERLINVNDAKTSDSVEKSVSAIESCLKQNDDIDSLIWAFTRIMKIYGCQEIWKSQQKLLPLQLLSALPKNIPEKKPIHSHVNTLVNNLLDNGYLKELDDAGATGFIDQLLLNRKSNLIVQHWDKIKLLPESSLIPICKNLCATDIPQLVKLVAQVALDDKFIKIRHIIILDVIKCCQYKQNPEYFEFVRECITRNVLRSDLINAQHRLIAYRTIFSFLAELTKTVDRHETVVEYAQLLDSEFECVEKEFSATWPTDIEWSIKNNLIYVYARTSIDQFAEKISKLMNINASECVLQNTFSALLKAFQANGNAEALRHPIVLYKILDVFIDSFSSNREGENPIVRRELQTQCCKLMNTLFSNANSKVLNDYINLYDRARLYLDLDLLHYSQAFLTAKIAEQDKTLQILEAQHKNQSINPAEISSIVAFLETNIGFLAACEPDKTFVFISRLLKINFYQQNGIMEALIALQDKLILLLQNPKPFEHPRFVNERDFIHSLCSFNLPDQTPLIFQRLEKLLKDTQSQDLSNTVYAQRVCTFDFFHSAMLVKMMGTGLTEEYEQFLNHLSNLHYKTQINDKNAIELGRLHHAMLTALICYPALVQALTVLFNADVEQHDREGVKNVVSYLERNNRDKFPKKVIHFLEAVFHGSLFPPSVNIPHIVNTLIPLFNKFDYKQLLKAGSPETIALVKKYYLEIQDRFRIYMEFLQSNHGAVYIASGLSCGHRLAFQLQFTAQLQKKADELINPKLPSSAGSSAATTNTAAAPPSTETPTAPAQTTLPQADLKDKTTK